jgi:hypothetical protein
MTTHLNPDQRPPYQPGPKMRAWQVFCGTVLFLICTLDGASDSQMGGLGGLFGVYIICETGGWLHFRRDTPDPDVLATWDVVGTVVWTMTMAMWFIFSLGTTHLNYVALLSMFASLLTLFGPGGRGRRKAAAKLLGAKAEAARAKLVAAMPKAQPVAAKNS